ncbi:MAG TPA: hypothetical protein VFJ64_10740 [Solirubrobacterales bacterium]|nr:hypothetical protein [Solirubrobacterales bacterium]
MTLVTFNGTTTGTKTVRFRVPTPDSRVRTKVALIGQPAPGGSPTFLSLKTVTLLLQAIEDAINGGMPIPVTSLPDPTVGTAIAIPEHSQLGGFSYESVSIGDAIEGTITVTSNSNAAHGFLMLQARYQPDGQRLPWDEWREIVSQCNPGLLTAAAVIK